MKLYQDSKKIIIHQSEEFFLSPKELLETAMFKEVLSEYYQTTITFVKEETLFNIYEQIVLNDAYLKELPNHIKEEVFNLTEGFYDYWRKKEKYLIFKDGPLLEASNTFNDVIIKTYRLITEGLSGKKNNVYRQLSAGFNVVLNHVSTSLFEGELSHLNDVICLNQMVIRPPFVIRTKSNTRKGLFKETSVNLFKEVKDLKGFFMMPIKVGRELALVYVKDKYLHHGISLSSLFEMADTKELYTLKPSLMIFFGVSDSTYDNHYYIDEKKSYYVGIVSDLEKNDYFGYMKKMLLTLHNLKKINEGCLPIHGAMAKITFNNHQQKYIMMVGDSGAGKSETLEALGNLGEGKIKSFDIIFDDMGYLLEEDNIIRASGTEIGAFVRIDDLDDGYIYREFDRSIFLNPERHNARLIIPVSRYGFIKRAHPIDMVLYINNYSMDDQILSRFSSLIEAKDVFLSGKRMAKGTTDEKGLVESFFSNPFGPVQKEMTTRFLVDQYFEALDKQGVYIGVLNTKLGVAGFEEEGPKIAANALLDYFNEKG
jgi:energy-coupling factor transporter ATP-binding protein EcfA2